MSLLVFRAVRGVFISVMNTFQSIWLGKVATRCSDMAAPCGTPNGRQNKMVLAREAREAREEGLRVVPDSQPHTTLSEELQEHECLEECPQKSLMSPGALSGFCT